MDSTESEIVDGISVDDYVEVYRDAAGEHRWRFKDGQNDNIIADSGEGYHNMADLHAAIIKVTGRGPSFTETKTGAIPGPHTIRVVTVHG